MSMGGGGHDVDRYAELRAIQRRLSWLESRLAELAEAVERARGHVAVGPLLEPPVEPAPAAILTDVILSAEDVARIAEAHRRLWEGEGWCTRCSGTMPCDANRLAASHERLRALADAAGRDGMAMRAVLRELPDAVKALARETYRGRLIPADEYKDPSYAWNVGDWGEAMRWCVEQAIKHALVRAGADGVKGGVDAT